MNVRGVSVLSSCDYIRIVVSLSQLSIVSPTTANDHDNEKLLILQSIVIARVCVIIRNKFSLS